MDKITLWRRGKEYLQKQHYPGSDENSRFLLQYVCGQNSSVFYLSLSERISEKQQERYFSLLKRLATGEPLAYIIQSVQFMGLDFMVDKRVLIPRPETELLVEEVIKHCRSLNIIRPVILDIGTGSGCILVTAGHFLKKGFFIGTDISWTALQVARQNAIKYCSGAEICFVNMDLFRGLKKSPLFHVIVSNPPYVGGSDCNLDETVKNHEPHIALYSGSEGRDHIRCILSQSRHFLQEHGLLFMEIGYNQFEWCLQCARAYKYSLVNSIQDYQGIYRHLVLKPAI